MHDGQLKIQSDNKDYYQIDTLRQGASRSTSIWRKMT